MRKKSEVEWERLWGELGRRFRKTVFELEGLLIKVGQLISTRADLLPEAFIQELEDLTDQVPPSNWEDIDKILESEWGSSYQDVVTTIEKEAVASASIGEVYRGVLHDGRKVAIKVQRPRIQSIVQTDFRTLHIVIWFAHHFAPIPKGFINLKVLFSEIKQVIERELDYVKEKETLIYFKERMKDRDLVHIPSVYTELCTSRVLVMEWVDGIKITDMAAVNRLDITRKELAEHLIKIFLPQWLEPGTFHADPHPGNILVSKEGKIILLDFGMVGEISKKDASAFQQLIESFLVKNYSKAVDSLSNLGFLLPEADKKMVEKLLAEGINFQPAQLNEIDIIAVKAEINDLIQALPIQVPTRFVFLGRSFVAIEGIVMNLVPEEDLIELCKPIFMEKVMAQGNQWSFIWEWLQSQPLFSIFHSAKEFLKLPERLERLKETEQKRQFQFTIYENDKKRYFILTIMGFLGIIVGYEIESPFTWGPSLGLFTVGIVGYVTTRYRLRKWLKYMPEKRR